MLWFNLIYIVQFYEAPESNFILSGFRPNTNVFFFELSSLYNNTFLRYTVLLWSRLTLSHGDRTSEFVVVTSDPLLLHC